MLAKETGVKKVSDAVKALFAMIEMGFQEVREVSVSEPNADTASTNSQTRLLEGLWQEMKSMNKKGAHSAAHNAS